MLKNSTSVMANKYHNCKTNDEIADAVFLLYPDLPDNQPIAYVSNLWYFYGLPFYIDENVLVPRFDTEVLVDTAWDALKSMSQAKVLDLCTGSGCIAVVLAKRGINVTASDISDKALIVARKNAKMHDVNVDFIQSDLFENIDGVFDVIVSNPPYIKTSEIGKDDKSILSEPRIALDGGVDGLDVYRKIANQAQKYLVDGGKLVLEIGCKQANDVKTILQNQGFGDIKIIKDTMGQDRVVICRKN